MEVGRLTVRVGADIDGLTRELNKATAHMGTFNKGMKQIGVAIAGAFAADKIIDFGKEIFNTTAKFQKFEAVLTNTLGSNSAAKAALMEITEFASKTPYQVDELTSSFVKLANQGFIPTLNQMRQLGDLAASQGKSFDQLTEAIIDAQTGEFERLKEFGIRAEKQGDQVTFTFKGVKQQVDFTAQSIREYVLALGNVEGVAGGMDAQSKTLGGGLSNLQDSFEQLKLAIGEAANSGGLFSDVLNFISSGVTSITDKIRTTKKDVFNMVEAIKQLKELRRKAAVAGDLDEWSRLNTLIRSGVEEVRKYYETNIKGQEELDKKRKESDALNNRPQLKAPSGNISLTSIQPIRSETLQSMEQLRITMRNISKEIVPAKMGIADLRMQFERLGEYFVDFAPIFNEAFVNLGVGLGEALGNMASGLGGAEQITGMLLSVFGNMAIQLGQLAISTGIAVLGIKQALMSLNPGIAIAAGVALVALGTMVSNKAKSIASGGKGSSSSSLSSSGNGSNVRNNGNLRNDSSAQDNKIVAETIIRGQDIWVVMKNFEKNSKYTKAG
jgi:hypothetical protein